MSNDQRIKLAEFVGWYQDDDGIWHGKGSTWDSCMFDPRNSADDCEALIRKLNELGCTLTITYAIDGEADGELLWEGTAFTTPYRKNGKMVACELAMKLIEQQEDGDDR